MCGDETPAGPAYRTGARVDLFTRRQTFVGNLIFHDPSYPGNSQATHARFTPGDGALRGIGQHPLLISIHQSGDLTRPSQECGLFHQFSIPPISNFSFFETLLETPVVLSVGGKGVIGRRVSISVAMDATAASDNAADRMAAFGGDGIVGFNSTFV